MDLALPPLPESRLSFFTPLDDARRLYRLEGDGAELSSLKVQAWSQREALSEPYDLEIAALSLDARLNLDAIAGARVRLVTRLADGSEHLRGGTILHVTNEHAEGGFARYRLEVGPWFSLLAYATHSRVWQDKSIVEIVDAVLGAYAHASWRWSACVADHLAQSPQHNARGSRPYCVQYRETDLTFVARLLAEEGLVYRFEAVGDVPDGLVILADTPRSESCPEDPSSMSTAGGAGIRFHRDAAIEEQDVILAFGARQRFPVYRLAESGWDPIAKRVIATRVVTTDRFGDATPRLERYEPGGAWLDAGKAQRATTLLMQAHEARTKTWIGRGTVRSFTAGQHFALQGSPLDELAAALGKTAQDEREYLITRATHAGINNLPQQLSEALANTGFDERDYYAKPLLPEWIDPEQRAQAAKSGYANRFEALQRSIPWRTPTYDTDGRRLHPRPRASMLIATVVGPNGETTPNGWNEIHTDRLGRVRIRYEFQRLGSHPSTSNASIWVRVLQPWAGSGMGCQFTPRIGHEVLVDFDEGDLERPHVVKVLYTGRGEGGVPATPGGAHGSTDGAVFGASGDHRPSGQGNLTGGSSPAWHGASPASLDAKGQANAGALSGIKTKEFGGSGYNQLVFDDTDNQLRVQLHSSQHASQLNLGHLIHQADNHRGALRGQGFELRTDAYGAIRGRMGVLLSTYGQSPSEPAGDNAAALALHGQLWTLSKAMSELAKTHETVQVGSYLGSYYANGSQTMKDEALLEAMFTILKGMVCAADLEQAQVDAAEHNTATGADKVPHTSEPVVVIAAKAGLVQVAGQHIEAAAAETLTLGAGQDINQAVGGAFRLHTGQAIGMLAGATKPGDEAAGKGITLIAGAGDVDIQAQSDAMQIAAKGNVDIMSRLAHIDWAAAKRIVICNEAGSSITIENGNITVECPGTLTIRAGKKSFLPGEFASIGLQKLPQATLALDQELVLFLANGEPAERRRFELHFEDGGIVRGVTDAAGGTGLKQSAMPSRYRISVLGPAAA